MRLSNRSKILIAFLSGVLIVAVLGALLGWTLLRDGSFQIQVSEAGPGGEDINIILPVFIAELGLRFMPAEAMAETLSEVNAELGDWWPLVQATCKELASSPDFDLVEVESDDERVRIVKRGKRLEILVHSEDEEVKVVVPIKAVSRILEKLAKAA